MTDPDPEYFIDDPDYFAEQWEQERQELGDVALQNTQQSINDQSTTDFAGILTPQVEQIVYLFEAVGGRDSITDKHREACRRMAADLRQHALKGRELWFDGED